MSETKPPFLTSYLVKRFTGQEDPTAPVRDPYMRSKYAFLEAIVSIVAVSYTHLDVYKRQTGTFSPGRT